MRRADTQKVLDTFLAATIGDRPSLTFGESGMDALPAGVKRFLAAGLDEQVRNRLGFAPAADRQTAALRSALIATLLQKESIPREQYIGMLTEAVDLLSEYLVTPRASLVRWIFREEPVVQKRDALSRLARIDDYRYLPEVVQKWMEGSRSDVIGRSDVASVVRAVDEQVVVRHSEAELIRLSRPIFEFFSWPAGRSGLHAPVDCVRTFYLEKGLDRFWARVSHGIPGETVEIPFETLLEAAADAEPVEERFEGDAPIMDGGESVPAVEPGEEDASVGPAGSPGDASQGLPDLASLISGEQEHVFVRSLFEHDPAFYSAIISSLNGIDTWKEAALYLSQFYQTNALDPFADDVVEFTDIIHRRYLQEGVR